MVNTVARLRFLPCRSPCLDGAARRYVESNYWQRHDLPQPEVPAPLRASVARLKNGDRPNGERWRTLRDVLYDLPPPADGEEHPWLAQHVAIPGARSYRKHTGSPYDWPSKTIKAGVHGVCGGESMIRYPDGQLRYLTVREAARVQGFSDTYGFPGTRSRVMGVIGNAVAVPVAQEIGAVLARTFLTATSRSLSRRADLEDF
jgi:DNA (cytosine-5)-methyltransferase 1